MPLPDSFTAHLRHVLQRASVFAHASGAKAAAPVHLLLAMTHERGSLGCEVLSKIDVKPERVRAALGLSGGGITEQARNTSGDTGSEQSVPLAKLSDNAKRALEKAALAASTHEHRYIGTEHLLAGLVETNDHDLTMLLTSLHVDPTSIAQHLLNVLKSTSKFPEFTSTIEDPREAFVEPMEATEETGDPQKTPALDFFAKDLTNPATATTIDPVVGRDTEIERVIQILCRRTKNNPILVGDPGVGKTAIVEGLARRIVERDVPDILIGKRILALDLALLVAGTIYRGEFESRLKQILDEVRQDPNLILFIDEIHTIMGAGAASGSLDAANILKPALARGEVRCIGATTFDEFKKHLENDAALERRFQQVQVTEPNTEATIEILRGLKPYYEQFHRVAITDDAIRAAVHLAERYLTDRRFPDKAIDLVDEASARLRVLETNDPALRRASAIEARLEQIGDEKRAHVLAERYGEAERLQQEQKRLMRERAKVTEHLEERSTEEVGSIDATDIAAVVAQTVHLPAAEILLTEHERFRTLASALRQRIIGQDRAVDAIAAALQRAKSGLAAPNRPLASFLLLGPTGVGKTETAKALAELLFDHADALIRLDMSEFSEGFSISKLIGAPAGYVGYREGSKLTDTIRKRPASVVLFDEIEKAHGDVWNLLLQILEDGRLTDATGRVSKFTNAIIVLTSNVGAEAFTRASIGFLDAATPGTANRRYDDIQTDALRELKSRFRPELLNRIDDTIVYRPLEPSHLAAIATTQLHAFAERLTKEQHITIAPHDAVTPWIAERAIDPSQGARAVRRLLHEYIENPIAQGILEERFAAGSALTITVADDRSALHIQKQAVTSRTKKRNAVV